MLVGSVITAIIAVVLAVPFAVATALLIEFYVPKWFKTILVSILDLVAALPSVVFGIWGYAVLLPLVEGWSKTMEHYLGWIPIFNVPSGIFGRSPFLAGLLLGLMIVPIITSVAREVYSQAHCAPWCFRLDEVDLSVELCWGLVALLVRLSLFT
jgi:phosphate transport system permease protein